MPKFGDRRRPGGLIASAKAATDTFVQVVAESHRKSGASLEVFADRSLCFGKKYVTVY